MLLVLVLGRKSVVSKLNPLGRFFKMEKGYDFYSFMSFVSRGVEF